MLIVHIQGLDKKQCQQFDISDMALFTGVQHLYTFNIVTLPLIYKLLPNVWKASDTISMSIFDNIPYWLPYSTDKFISCGTEPHHSSWQCNVRFWNIHRTYPVSPCDYDLFAKPLQGTRYNTRDELIRVTGRATRNINKDGLADSVRRLSNIWQKW